MPEDAVVRRVAEEEEEDIVLTDEEGDEDEDMVMENPLVDLLVTSNGENIADGIVGALDRVCRHLDAQNKIFIKMYTVLSKLTPAQPTA